MKALDRKVLRDLRLMWSQALTIALVVASGIAGFITTLSAVESLQLARDRFYAEGRFADIFAGIKRAPRAAATALAELPGVADVQTTIEQIVRIELPGSADAVIGMGGYVCFPGGMMASLLGRPLVLVNADASLLLSNRALMRGGRP